MKIDIEDLKALPQQRAVIDFKETIAGLEAVKPVLGELTLALNSYGVKVSGRIQTLLKLSCDRCLRPFFQGLTIDIDEQFVWQTESGGQRERELLKDDFVETIPSDGKIDLTDVVYQSVTLATPSISRCGDECPGVPPGAGNQGVSLAGDKNKGDFIDPRWKNLKTIFANDEKDKK